MVLFLLRRTSRHETELLLRHPGSDEGGSWSLPACGAGPGTREAELARGLAGEVPLARLYAAPFFSRAASRSGARARVAVFVAFAAAEADCDESETAEGVWWPLRRAAERLPKSARPGAERVWAEFVRRSPDEALRIF